jgi:S-(hydroxymethyl)glutathione synthase
MQVVEALVSGSLGQAIYCQDGTYRILDGTKAKPRDALPNEVQWFRHIAREVVLAHPKGLPVSIDLVRKRLDEEIRFFVGLDGLLVGMDPDFSETTRTRAISRAENILASDDAIVRRIRQRFLTPANTQWDPSGGYALAIRNGTKAAAECYRILALKLVDRLAEEVDAFVLEGFGSGLEANRAREIILHSGLLAEVTRGDRAAISALASSSNDPAGQILRAFVRRVAMISIHPAVDNGVKPGSANFAGGALVCNCDDKVVKIGIKGDVAYNHLCGCTKCWRPNGATYAMVAMVSRDNTTVLENSDKLQVVDASATIQRHACKVCGTHMYGRIENKAHPFYGLDFIHPELFEEVGWAAPRFTAFVSAVTHSGVNPVDMPDIRSRLKELGLEPYDCLSPELMDKIDAHINRPTLTNKSRRVAWLNGRRGGRGW